MAKIILIVPTDEMYDRARSIISHVETDIELFREYSQTVLSRVESEQAQGAMVAIARGNHAALILSHTNMPLVEIRLSGQSIAQLIAQAKILADKEHPNIAFVGFVNMFTDTQPFASMLDVTVTNYFIHESEELQPAVRRAHEAGVDVLIGGEIAIHCAQQLGMKTLFLQSGDEDLKAAIRSAKRVLFGIETEKKNTAEVASLLDHSFDGILRLNDDGEIVIANYMAERIFERSASLLVGKSISSLFDEHDTALIMEAIHSGSPKYGITLRRSSMSLVANAAAIVVDGRNTGGILSFQEFKIIEELEEGIRRTRVHTSLMAKHHFNQLHYCSERMQQVCRAAEQYARFDTPILLRGPFGTGKQTLAECIHNTSMRRKNPFVVFDCAITPPEEQKLTFVGRDNRGALQMAHTGTLFINHIERMDAYCQYQLLCGLRDGIVWPQGYSQALPVNVRIVASTGEDLYPLVEKGSFSQLLYCLLIQLELVIPSLKECRDEIPALLNEFLEKYSSQYKKYIVLTPEARSLISSMDWPGNRMQLELFVERLVLLSESRVVDARFVKEHRPTGFQNLSASHAKPESESIVICDDSEAAAILTLLNKHKGSRVRVAEEMGISKSTLWRKMKKLGIQ